MQASIYRFANISKADLRVFIARKHVTMMRLECLPKRTANVREKDYMKIKKLRVHAGRTGSVSRLVLYPSNSPRGSQGYPGKLGMDIPCNQHTQLT